MFTGIIEEIGYIKSIKTQSQAMQLAIGADTVLGDAKVGDSIAVNGVCLTVTTLKDNVFTVDVMPETFRATTMSLLNDGSQVNLERSLAVGERFGGHFVTGHVDGVGEIIQITPVDNAVNYRVRLSADLIRYCVFRGSVAVDGTSLTIFGVEQDYIQLALIPHTLTHTILGSKQVGDKVNIECDMLSKHVANLVARMLPAGK